MKSGGNNFNDFSENQLTKFRAVYGQMVHDSVFCNKQLPERGAPWRRGDPGTVPCHPLKTGLSINSATFLSASLYVSKRGAYYGRPLSVSGRPCYILPMVIYLFIFLWPFYSPAWLTEVRESFTRGGP